jgi:hypothetical protein
LPEAYGTQRVLLIARDPHWLYAHWDLTREQQRHYNALSRDRHLVARVYLETVGSLLAAEVHVHPESRYWFIHVERAGMKYVCELGFYGKDERWRTVATSGTTITPPETITSDVSAQFVAVPTELPLGRMVELVKEAARENLPLAVAIEELREQGHPDLPAMPFAEPVAPAPWTPAQEQALAEVISMDKVRRIWMGSLEITELIRGQLVREMASQAAAAEAPAGAPPSPAGAPGGITSPMGAGQAAPSFWLNVNAELIVYGATEPTATVTIGGREIGLRPDGSFSYRFALPDGQYELPVIAVSADRTDGRAAQLHFIRGTEYLGDVGISPQDPSLKRPEPESL